MMSESEFELDQYPMFQLERSYESLATLYFLLPEPENESEGLNDEQLMELKEAS